MDGVLFIHVAERKMHMLIAPYLGYIWLLCNQAHVLLYENIATRTCPKHNFHRTGSLKTGSGFNAVTMFQHPV